MVEFWEEEKFDNIDIEFEPVGLTDFDCTDWVDLMDWANRSAGTDWQDLGVSSEKNRWFKDIMQISADPPPPT